MMDKLNLHHFHFSLSTSILYVLFAVGCLYPGTSRGQSWELVEAELTQYTLSPTFERVIQQFVQEGETTFYKDGPALMAIDFDKNYIHITGDTSGQWANMTMFSDNILGYFSVSGSDFIIYGEPKYIENICFKGTRKHKFEMWRMLEPFFGGPNISYMIMQGKAGQFRLIKEYYDPDAR